MSLRRVFILGMLGNVLAIAWLGSIGLVVGLRAYRAMTQTTEVRMPRALAISRLREYGAMLVEQWNQFLWRKEGADRMAQTQPGVAVELRREAYRKLIEAREFRSRLAVWLRVYQDMNPSSPEELRVCAVVDSLLRLSRALEAGALEQGGFPDLSVRRREVDVLGLQFRNAMDQATALEQQRVRDERAEAERGVRGGLVLFVLAVLAGLAGAAGLGLFITARTAKPVMALAQAANAVAHGRFDVRVDEKPSGEIGALIRNFNRMVERLQETTIELEASNEALREELEERRRAEAQLEQERNLLRAVIDHIPDGVYFKDRDGKHRLANEPFLLIAGSTAENLDLRAAEGGIGEPLGALLAEVEAEARQYLRSCLEREKVLQRPDGSLSVFRVSAVPVRDPEGMLSGIVGIVRDVTQQREAERQIRESEERYREVFETAPMGMFVVDPTGKVVAVNDSLLAILGSPSRDLTMKINVLEHPHLRRFGFSEPVEECIRSRSRVRKEFTYRSLWGKEVEVAMYLSPILGEGGEVRFVQGIVDDMTERKRLQQQLLQAQKMEAIGRLAGGIAHDFNNIMTGILGYAQFLLTECSEDDPRRSDLVEIEKLARRAASLTQQLLAFSRQQVLQPRPLNLNGLLLDMEKMLRRLIGEDIELRVHLADRLPYVETDPVQMQQVIMNLVVNARDAMPNGGTLTIETRPVEVDAEFAARHLGLKPGLHVLITVSDTGVGMDEATKARAFEPFFTTKKFGQGTGLGLPTVKGIVEQSGGAVWLYSELGKGTTVKIFLPASVQSKDTGDSWRPEDGNGHGAETILFVEDEDAIRDMMLRALTNLGYRVLVAANADEALRICERYEGQIDLLLTDVVMPGMNGPRLAEEIRKRYPNIRVLFTSGYTDEVIVNSGLRQGDVQLVQKPYTPTDLARKIREVLEKADA